MKLFPFSVKADHELYYYEVMAILKWRHILFTFLELSNIIMGLCKIYYLMTQFRKLEFRTVKWPKFLAFMVPEITLKRTVKRCSSDLLSQQKLLATSSAQKAPIFIKK